MKQAARWVCVLGGASLIGWSHTHTDEIPVVLGLVLILSSILGAVFPSRPWITGFVLGGSVFFVETLVHYSVIRAHYPPSAGLPWAALFALLPGMGGAFFGSAVRHLNHQPDSAR